MRKAIEAPRGLATTWPSSSNWAGLGRDWGRPKPKPSGKADGTRGELRAPEARRSAGRARRGASGRVVSAQPSVERPRGPRVTFVPVEHDPPVTLDAEALLRSPPGAVSTSTTPVSRAAGTAAAPPERKSDVSLVTRGYGLREGEVVRVVAPRCRRGADSSRRGLAAGLTFMTMHFLDVATNRSRSTPPIPSPHRRVQATAIRIAAGSLSRLKIVGPNATEAERDAIDAVVADERGGPVPSPTPCRRESLDRPGRAQPHQPAPDGAPRGALGGRHLLSSAVDEAAPADRRAYMRRHRVPHPRR